MGKALFEVSYEQLKELLCLPVLTDLLFVREGECNGNFEVMVEHPDLPKGLVRCEPEFKTARSQGS